MKRLRCACLAALLLPALAATAFGQVARVAGIVRDDAGKPVSGATVTASNADQAPSTITASTDERGRFAILGLRRGAWVFAFDSPGFKTTRVTGDVQVGRPNPAMNVTLLRSTPAPSTLAAGVTGAELQRLIDAAEAAAAAGNLETATSGYRELLSKVPGLTTGYLRLGAILEQKGDAAGALEAYRRLLTVEPANTRAAEAIARLTRPPG